MRGLGSANEVQILAKYRRHVTSCNYSQVETAVAYRCRHMEPDRTTVTTLTRCSQVTCAGQHADQHGSIVTKEPEAMMCDSWSNNRCRLEKKTANAGGL
nr:hypothetical protein CFP56_12197 [Quercus suber]